MKLKFLTMASMLMLICILNNAFAGNTIPHVLRLPDAPRQFVLSDLPKSLQRATPASVKEFLHNGSANLDTNARVIKRSNADPAKYNQTGLPLDFALLDDGYIVMRDINNDVVLTRYGRMDIVASGALTISGLAVQQQICSPDASQSCDIHIPATILPPAATTLVKIKASLNAEHMTSDEYYLQPTIFDARGGTHSVLVQFNPLSINEVAVEVTNENKSLIATGTLNFDSTGKLAKQVGLQQISIDIQDPNAPKFDFDFSGSTNYSNMPLDSTFSIDADGYSAGLLQTVTVAIDGSVHAPYDNGIDVNFAQINIADTHQEDLTPYLPLYPRNFLTFKEHSANQPPLYAARIRVLPGWLEKSAYRLPGT